VYRSRLSPPITEPKRMSKQGEGLKGNGPCAPLRSRRTTFVIPEHHPEAHPMIVQLDVGLIRSALLLLKKRAYIECRLPLQHVVHCTGQLMG
jgi:hypothetical protein